MPPSTKGLEFLTRKTPLSDQEWLKIIEARREMIKPHLDTFTLKTLGDVECLKRETFKHPIRFDRPECVGGEFSLDTQGIFRTTHSSRINTDRGVVAPPGGVNVPDGVQYIWGLTRKAQWIIAGVSYVGEPGYKGRGYERATRVEIEEATIFRIASVCKFRYQEIHYELGREILSWSHNRQRLYDDARNLAEMCQIEDLALSIVPVTSTVTPL